MTLDAFLTIVAAHPHACYTALFLVALSESLAGVGLIIPGTVLMFGAGAVIGTGALALKPALLLAMAGAAAGDGISFYLGRYHHRRIRNLRPLRKHPELIQRGVALFRRHGGKSVLFGRFVGPLRPVIPMVAGIMGMGGLRFTLVNILSAAGWAVAYLLPGVLFGTSLTLAGRISARLALLLLLIVTTVWAVLYLFRKLFLLSARWGTQGIEGAKAWMASDIPLRGMLGTLKRTLRRLLVRRKGEEYLLVFLVLLLFVATWGFLEILDAVIGRTPLVRADRAVYHFLQSLRNPWADRFFVAVTELGDRVVNSAVAAAVLVTLLLARRYRTAAYWVATLAGGALLVRILKWSFHLPRPVHLFEGTSAFGFPSGHTTMTVVLYGFLAVLLARGLDNAVRLGLFGTVLAAASAMGLSRLYLGAHWLTDVLGGLFLASIWTALAGIAYLSGERRPVPRRILALIVLFVFTITGYRHISLRHTSDLELYAARPEIGSMETGRWLAQGWSELPAWRIDLAGEEEQPLTFQWAGSPESLERRLTRAGWKRPPPGDLRRYLVMLSPEAAIWDLPLFPHLHDGRFERLLLWRREGSGRLVFRLWPADIRLSQGEPLWVGTVETQRARRLADLITLPVNNGDYRTPLTVLQETLTTRDGSAVIRKDRPQVPPAHGPAHLVWDGRVLLCRPVAATMVPQP